MPVILSPGYWYDRQDVNAKQAIFHQWQMLEQSGCINNFRIAAGEIDGWREGWYFADSDAYKWLDAAARIYAQHKDEKLAGLMNDFISLIGSAQQPDGYLFTYNQVHFPQVRWANLQIEHELYCHGHLIEAGVSHYLATSQTTLLDIARNAANRIVADFSNKPPIFTPGHEEIEIALLRLYQVTSHKPYLEMAEQFINRRGRTWFFGLSLLRQYRQANQRSALVKKNKQQYFAKHPETRPNPLPAGNAAQKPKNIQLRWMWNALTGKYFQQHQPVNSQVKPVGHAVRYTYLATAASILARLTGDKSRLRTLEHAWNWMVSRRMYLTGGIGSLPVMESFGRDYELDPEYAYAETCAAIGSFLWNWELAQLTGKACYSDLMEWQLYNAISVGMGLDGTAYLYNNPLACHGGISRKPWFEIPCCPSNLSRTLASLAQYIYSDKQNAVWIHQYISSTYQGVDGLRLDLQSSLPWKGRVTCSIVSAPDNSQSEYAIHFRIPSWSKNTRMFLNGTQIPLSPGVIPPAPTAGGYDPRLARWHTIQRVWSPGDVVEIELDMQPCHSACPPQSKEPPRSGCVNTRTVGVLPGKH